MVKNCVVRGCGNRWSADTNVSFHRFPKEVEARRKWLSALQLNDLVNFECSSVCSAHFLPEEIVVTRSGRRHYLVEGSVPSRLPPNQRINTVQDCSMDTGMEVLPDVDILSHRSLAHVNHDHAERLYLFFLFGKYQPFDNT
ncbi:hypothetical protein CAPTEDRAFT_186797 [Capitella teleta]|uniref:THAP-type domain-containing protein n=1 Tax=Capitella teleta TaxID=283909 RepID=R7UH00_CAPTE|nr:hypothetical protein CAPTEDRAFT_186797 [Capitella teleta]|eukprot:ELU03068.1 hypothetical protein CAPTEDRAFT_186797 [Capitella teleta]